MADSETVVTAPVGVPRQPETGSDLGMRSSSPVHGLKQSSRKLEEHEEVLKRCVKRRRVSSGVDISPTVKESMISAFRKEMDELFQYFNKVLVWQLGSENEKCCSVNSVMACILEGSNLPLSRLANEIYGKLKVREAVSLASIQRDVHFISSRLNYGMDGGDPNFLEDESKSCLWCWEVRDLKLLPKIKQKVSKVLRKGREKVRERITALSEMLLVLTMPESQVNYVANFSKALEKLSKTSSLEEICSLVQKLRQKSGDEIAKIESRSKEKDLLKEMEKNMRNAEKEMKKLDWELHKQKSQTERELKRRQVETEKVVRRREKEEAEAKKRLSIQKQASLMEQFLKSKTSNNMEVDKLSKYAQPSDYSEKNFDTMGSTMASIDLALSQQDNINSEDLWKSHITAWHKMRHTIESSHWSIRRKPKTRLINELKLQGPSCEPGSRNIKPPERGDACDETKGSHKGDFNSFADEIEEDAIYNLSCHNNDYIASKSMLLIRRAIKLLQFDRSYRPAYYGSWSKKSVIVGPRRPFAKDNALDYDFDSDEEWEEEEPGECLSDCDKDDEEEIPEGGSKQDDEDENEDSFFVPDGYLSENEGVQVDSVRMDCVSDEVRCSPTCTPEVENEEFLALLRQQKYIDCVTQQALRKNQPLIITNLLHDKDEILTGTSKVEQICLRGMCMVACPGGPIIEESFIDQSSGDPDTCHTKTMRKNAPFIAATVPDPDLPEYVHCIQSNPNVMAKVIESLHQRFPSMSSAQLRNKVREISEFVNNQWQVKKEVLDKLGISSSPDKCKHLKGTIATFFSSKRCLPPTGGAMNLSESSPPSCPKSDALASEDSHHVSSRY